MNVQVFDTHVRTLEGAYLHFDVLIEGQDQELDARHARDWLASRGVMAEDVAQSRCQFCHSEPLVMFTAAQQKEFKETGGFIISLPA